MGQASTFEARAVLPIDARLRRALQHVTDPPVELRETHLSWVFLTPDRAYKLRKPVRHAFVDQSTPARRTTDSELIFHLALTFGLRDDPIGGLERMAGFVEATCERHGIDTPLQMTIGVSNGTDLWAARYASGPVVNTLFVSQEAQSLRELYPERPRFAGISDDTRVIVSEPLVDLPGVWHEIEESTALVIGPGGFEQRPFSPRRAGATGSGRTA
jgi:predicted glutamine amidotransferase